MKKDKEYDKLAKQTEKLIQRTTWLVDLMSKLSKNPEHKIPTPIWMSVVGSALMVGWLCLPFLALVLKNMILFEIFAGITTFMAICWALSSSIEGIKRKKNLAANLPGPVMELAPEMLGSLDFNEFINLSWRIHQKSWENGETISFHTSASRVAKKCPELYSSALLFIKKQRHGHPKRFYQKRSQDKDRVKSTGQTEWKDGTGKGGIG